MKSIISTSILISFCLLNLSFEFGFDPEIQKFKKMVVEYRDFQGENKKSFKLEEIIKNENGWITSHNYYDPSGNLINGSVSFIYDNNGNIKEKKFTEFVAAKNKNITQKLTYTNSFSNGKLKQTIISDKENPGNEDTIYYVRNMKGELTEKKDISGSHIRIMYFNTNGKEEKETELVSGKVTFNRKFEYSSNGIKLITATNNDGEVVQRYQYEYNEKGRIIKIDKVFKGLDIDFHASYKYNQVGQLITEERNDRGVKNVIVYEYNESGMVNKISVKNEKTIRLNERVYTYE